MKNLLIIIFILTSSFSFSQKAKSSLVYAHTYAIPPNYLPKGYDSYYSKITLPKKPIQVFVNNEYHSDLSKIQFNTFFKEDIYKNLFSSITGLMKEKEYDNADLIIDATVMNPKINIKIEEEKPLVDYKGRAYKTPHSYNYSYAFEIDFTINSRTDKKNIFSYKTSSSEKYKPTIKDRIVFFEKKEDAINYSVKLIDQTIITGELYKLLMKSLGGKSSFKRQIQFSKYEHPYYFYKVSRKKKHPKIEPLNNAVDLFISKIKIIGKSTYKQTKSNENNNFKTQIQNENNKNVVAYKFPASTKSNPKLINLVLKFEKTMNSMNNFSNLENKAEKAMAWSTMINNAHAFFIIGDFEKALNYFNKAEIIDKKNTIGFKNKMMSKIKRLKMFYDDQNNIKNDVNNIYLDYIRNFKL